MSAIIAHGANHVVGQRVAFSSSQRSRAPHMLCSGHFMNISRTQSSRNPNKSNIAKNVANKGFIASSAKQSRASLTPCAALINVEFLVPELPLEFGQSLKIVGGASSLGNWEASTGATLEWQEGNNWKGAVEVESGSEVEFKLVKVAGEDWSSWEDGENKVLAVPATATGVHVVCNWGGAELTVKISEAAAAAEEQGAKKSTKSSSSTKTKAPKKAAKEEKKVAEPKPVVAAAAAPVAVAEKEEAPQEPIAAPEESSPAPDHSETDNGSSEAAPAPAAPEAPAPAAADGVDLPSEMSSLASKVSVGSDGALVIEFGSSADGVSAASLAEKLKK